MRARTIKLPLDGYHVMNQVEYRNAKTVASHAERGTTCSHYGCNQPAIACHVSQTIIMPAPGFYMLCTEHASLAVKGK